ncbi:MAG: hypothetical protein KDB22_27785 [Planctomycetales bacterium]|nr:hypothetical protein [Planctomycetales bacterium]
MARSCTKNILQRLPSPQTRYDFRNWKRDFPPILDFDLTKGFHFAGRLRIINTSSSRIEGQAGCQTVLLDRMQLGGTFMRGWHIR